MRILIIGAGNAGRHVAERLRSEKHDVIVVDIDRDVLETLRSELDILTVVGNGSDPNILEQAEVRKADLVIAATSNDEVNILAALLAHKVGVPKTVARVTSPSYVHPPPGLNLQSLGVDLLISQREECASEIFNILRMPGVTESIDFFDGKLLAIGLQVHMDSPLLRTPLRDLPEKELLNSIRLIAVRRGKDNVFVPRGDTILEVGDIVYLCGRADDLEKFQRWAWPDSKPFERVVIAGGGELGVRLAQLLEQHTDNPIALVERDEDRASVCSGILTRTLVIRGDALEEDVLKDAGVVKGSAFVATTHDDEKNLFACLLAQQLGASYNVAQIGKPDYIATIQRLGLVDRIVSPPLSMNNAILHFLRGGYVQEAGAFRHIPGEFLDFVLAVKSPWTGKAVRNLRIPEGVVLVGIQRNSDVVVPVGDLVLKSDDRVVVYALSTALPKLDKLLKR